MTPLLPPIWDDAFPTVSYAQRLRSPSGADHLFRVWCRVRLSGASDAPEYVVELLGAQQLSEADDEQTTARTLTAEQWRAELAACGQPDNTNDRAIDALLLQQATEGEREVETLSDSESETLMSTRML